VNRREFIKVVSVTAASLALQPATSLGDIASAQTAPYEFNPANQPNVRFPQSVLSGDPTPNSVMLWTRVQPDAPTANVAVAYQVAKTADFADILTQGTFNTGSETDYTVRIKLTDLEPGTYYYYRFIYDRTSSRVGRTKTAPALDSNTEVKFGFISCQDYTNGYYAVLGLLAQEDIDFVVHLGDYIYETTGEDFQGKTRAIQLPDGTDLGGGRKFATTLNDYRALYKTYRTDPQMQSMNEMHPLIAIWDDHEFSNDAWGANGTYSDGRNNELNEARRKAANRAWFEFMPADIPAYDDSKPFNESIKIYRNFRFGRLLELIMTDERLYRSDHLIPEGPAIAITQKPANSSLGSRYLVPKAYFDTLEAAQPPITMLGDTQKAWFKEKLKNSGAVWKVWGNEVSLIQMLLNLTQFRLPPFYLNLDQWDGYNRERRELLQFMRENSIRNVMAVTGDIHAFFAGNIYENPDDRNQPPVMVDFTCAGVASQPFFYALYNGSAAQGSAFALLEPILRYNPATDTNGVDGLLLGGNPAMRHARTLAFGYATVRLTAERAEVALKEMQAVDSPQRTLKRVYNYSVALDKAEVVPEPGTYSPATGASRWLAATGYEVTNQHGFLNFWLQNGGLRVFGSPIGPIMLEEGKAVQYFERARLEAFPGNPEPYRVQGGLLGSWAAAKVAGKRPFERVSSQSGAVYFPESGHNVRTFAAFWQQNGGLSIFGYPLCEEFDEDFDGRARRTQYFERAVLRSYPENDSANQIQPDALGVAYYRATYFV
jgi:alkaline phosphatase D